MLKQTVSNKEFISDAYRELLKREPDEEGLQYWIDDIEERGESRENVISNIKLSEEYKNLQK
tara:strand:+ start:324 stop:509 length:186 start_codon:yes stop_codon:yes gene_type:complete